MLSSNSRYPIYDEKSVINPEVNEDQVNEQLITLMTKPIYKRPLLNRRIKQQYIETTMIVVT